MKNRMTRTIAVLGLVAVAGSAFAFGGARAARGKGLIAALHDVNGERVGTVRFVRLDDGKVRVKIGATGLTAGFHGFHVHAVGTCDPGATDTAGNPVPFFTAGGHYNPVATNTHGAHAGDMPPLLVADDGTVRMRFKTDRFTLADLRDEDGSAVIVHAGPDNLAHIPATSPTGGERYHSHVDDVMGADTATKATGDAGSRFACGIVEKA
ncbi:MAG: superoxide dismutase family protein [Actinomycetota bacterium]